MRRITVTVSICLLITIKAFCQPYGPMVFSERITFEGNTSYCLRIDTSQAESIWTIGQPSKIFFDSAYSANHAILTDSLNSYPANCNSYFDLIIKQCDVYWYGEGILSFWHKYDTDTLKDGGYIEVSSDGGNSWKNIIDDSENMDLILTNFYLHSDTLFDGTPAFSGHSDDWQYSEIYWFWDAMTKPLFDSLIVRFNFKSDSENNNKEGWLIDDINFNGYHVMGNSTNLRTETHCLYPNPASNSINIQFNNPDRKTYTFKLFESNGKLLLLKDMISDDNVEINTSSLNEGSYEYILYSKEISETGTLIIRR